jgi:histidine triad (HIT) family protein
MANCIFCKIVAGESPAQMLYQDEQVSAFRDIHPVAPTHVLVVPNRHIVRLQDLSAEDGPLIGHIYRVIINNGPHGGQVVHHLHVHLIGGQRMRHPMG